MQSHRCWLILCGLPLLSACAIATSAPSAFDDCLATVAADAHEQDVASEVTHALLSGLTPNLRVLELDRRQPEFSQPFKNYLDGRVTDQRIRQGQLALQRNADLLKRVEAEYGVPANILVAFWGLETNYGNYLGNLSTIRSLATLACDNRRPEFFRQELIAALQLVDAGTVSPDQLRGSWAGAVGNFQFLPSVYRDYAVDADGDGRIDLWNNFADAAESAAKFLIARGWSAKQPWGYEIRLPSDFDYAVTDSTASIQAWADQGVTRADGSQLAPSDTPATLIMPAGANGPTFLVYPNFDVIMRWNPSQFYALSVGHLADRLHGAGPLIIPPPVEPALSVEIVANLQTQLSEQGFDPGVVDGLMGPATRKAIRAFQAANGLLPDGHPSPQTLLQLGVMPTAR